MTFGEKLQKLRAREGLSQDGLAELLDVSRQAVSKWERDETMPEAEKIIRLSDQFRVTTDYLLKESGEESPAAPPARSRWTPRQVFGWGMYLLTVYLLVRLLPGLANILKLTGGGAALGTVLRFYAPHLLTPLLVALLGFLALRKRS